VWIVFDYVLPVKLMLLGTRVYRLEGGCTIEQFPRHLLGVGTEGA
jgi:hypothetical protein